MVKVYIAPEKYNLENRYIKILFGILVGVAFVTVIILGYLMIEYKHQFSIFNQLKQKYYDQREMTVAIENKPQVNLIDISMLDKIMQSRPDGVAFNRIKLTQIMPLQIEGLANNPIEVEEIVKNASSLDMKLQISQVQADNDQKIIFELKQK
ncbi:hypothetical protein ACKESD_18005 [Acinetobacter baumannii]|uniref:hypothetical protein n=1 Tax=Acinetobacter baumannii TaxID=470 RepID=UPI000D0BC218|nr:hypothetical protein [Acinetobacter baumannii]MDC4785842.1 hypothetical protein [Acinetobacter baumannii]MDH2582844.1 hypothetical protein [Acinetobacter baumannii]PSE09466.1 hypothetical protein C7G98_13450 [Acinetobacter baumannii]HEO1806480.1 hypothetical protein [Acinetobacter baumannii]